jgi:hypothetical protein
MILINKNYARIWLEKSSSRKTCPGASMLQLQHLWNYQKQSRFTQQILIIPSKFRSKFHGIHLSLFIDMDDKKFFMAVPWIRIGKPRLFRATFYGIEVLVEPLKLQYKLPRWFINWSLQNSILHTWFVISNVCGLYVVMARSPIEKIRLYLINHT